ncbi:MAG: hypothetical protein SGI91_06200 [Alphaproteobacteria bacterium]|jgi:hypothetical protein|nr:hypothetical protein [Alphaproteobacteria bacterium]MDZ4866896.1 hypothetical protein [Alphaproteobacteria bacterium]
MLGKIVGVVTVGLMAAVLVLLQLGLVASGDAFFIAAAIVVVFTGQQLIAREQMGFADAAKSIFTRPGTFRSRSSFTAYFACLALGAVVTAQVLLGA